mmetsp:Transcript_2263/g.3981  ORF Transcript_2263/g.3981 Transcript_2263/m.3981 type:complete len:195 (-) Transcript_2263:959-1543(-)
MIAASLSSLFLDGIEETSLIQMVNAWQQLIIQKWMNLNQQEISLMFVTFQSILGKFSNDQNSKLQVNALAMNRLYKALELVDEDRIKTESVVNLIRSWHGIRTSLLKIQLKRGENTMNLLPEALPSAHVQSIWMRSFVRRCRLIVKVEELVECLVLSRNVVELSDDEIFWSASNVGVNHSVGLSVKRVSMKVEE